MLLCLTYDVSLLCSSKPITDPHSDASDVTRRPVLTLDPLPDDVSDTPYKVPLKLDGQLVTFDTHEWEDLFGVKVYAGSNGRCVIINVSPQLQKILDELEERVKELLPLKAVYKPLHKGSEMVLPLSHYIRYYTYNDKFERKMLSLNTQLQKFGPGKFVYELCASHVYFGPHQGGETCSLSLQISAINWKPSNSSFSMKHERSLNPGQSPFQNGSDMNKHTKPPLNRQHSIIDNNPFRRRMMVKRRDNDVAEVDYAALYEEM